MKIAILGASSFLARHILASLSGPHQVTLYSRSEQPPNDLGAAISIETKKLDVGDFSLEQLTTECVEQDVVVNCVAAGVQPGNDHSDDDIWLANAFFPIRLTEALIASGFSGRLITFGSYFEIGLNDQPDLLDEAAFCSRKAVLPNAYCRSKKAYTDYVANRTLDTLPFRHYHLVLTNIYGHGEHTDRLIPYIVRQVIKGERLEFSSGIQKRQYTHVKDIARWMDAFLQMTDAKAGIYHLTDEALVTVRSVIETTLQYLSEKGHREVDYEFRAIQKRDSNMLYLGLSAEKAGTLLSWQPKITLREGISEYYENS